jgi:hypothetical protein
MIRPWRRKARVDGASEVCNSVAHFRAVKHDLGAFELRAEGRTVNATADGRTFGVLLPARGVVRLRPPVALWLRQ